MRFPQFFIARPIAAIVLSLAFVIAGALAFFRLPLSEYPAVTPPTVQVTASYPGASPQVLADTVAQPLEQALVGTPDMMYLTGQSATDGRVQLTATFRQSTDPDLARIAVQNRVDRAEPRLPEEVRRLGLVTQSVAPDILMVVHLVGTADTYDPLYISNYALLNVRDELAAIPGIADTVVWGAGEYAMRIWFDPAKLTARGLTAGDVIAALRSQNIEAASGALGSSPGSGARPLTIVEAEGRLQSVEDFERVVLRAGEDGRIVRLGDVAHVEMGADSYSLRARLDDQRAVAIQILQDPGANALEVSSAVRETMARLSQDFPQGVEYRIAYDPTLFVRASLEAVSQTLIEAVLLVILVVIVFLRVWRAALIPVLAVPVSIVGTLAVLHLLGFSLNTLSLFGLVLSIGIVVDDAIVVVENVQRHLAMGEGRLEAARNAMAEVTKPIVATTLVLATVFVPTAFLSGLQGAFYQQFAVTIAASTIISSICSLTLSPALAAMLLKERDAPEDRVQQRLDRWFGRFFDRFERFWSGLTDRYRCVLRTFLDRPAIGLVIAGVLVGITVLGLARTPTGFVPAQDKYYLVGVAQLPAGASLERTDGVVARMSEIMLEEPGVANVVAFPGVSVNGFANLPNTAVVFAVLDPFEERGDTSLSAEAIAGSLTMKFSAIPDGFAGVFPPPPVPGLGNTGGFKLYIEAPGETTPQELAATTGAVLAAAAERPKLTGVMTSFETGAPQIALALDRERALAAGVPPEAIFEALRATLGSAYVNDFTRFGRTYRVFVQADAPARLAAEDIERLRVRGADGRLLPLASFVDITETAGPDRIMSYDGSFAADVTGSPAPGVSSGQAIAAMAEVMEASLPPGYSWSWTDLTYQQEEAGGSSALVFALVFVFAFLVLAAFYGNWTLPAAIMPLAPIAILGALVGVWLSGGDNNLFTQIAMLVLVGLAAKNAILIVEFARDRETDGETPLGAVVEAASIRLRPIVMTSLAFIVGVLPLVLAGGAGQEMRQAMGVSVFWGMIVVLLAGAFLTPSFYLAIRRWQVGRHERGNVTSHADEKGALA